MNIVPSETVRPQTAQYAAKPELTSGIASFNSAVNRLRRTLCGQSAGSVNPADLDAHRGDDLDVGVLVLLLALVSF
ncbi:MAG: hypothetical protein ACLSCX_02385 [Oscillospiraceae bacterium]